MKKNLLLIFSLLLAIGIVGCSASEATNDTEDNTSESTNENENGDESNTNKGANSKVLTIARGADVVTFDIHDHNNTSTEAVHTNMYDYLVKRNSKGELKTNLAKSWENIDDKTWEFTLRDDVTFHNGDPLTAKDVKFTLERVANDNTLLEHGNYKQIKEVKVINDNKFQIITHGPEPALINRLSRLGSGILPSEYIKDNGWDHYLKKPIGTGPYKFKEWKKGDRLVLVTNKEYFGGQPKWEKVIFRTIPEDSTRVSELLTGGVDIAANIPPSDWERVKNEENVSISKNSTQRVMMLIVRQSEGTVTADPKVREAIELAIDSEGIVESLLQGAGTITRTRVTPGNTGANKDLYKTTQYNPEKAKQLLKEAGYEDGLELTLSAPNGRYLKDKESAELMAAMLGQVGIKVNLELLEWSKYIEKYKNKSFNELYLIGYGNSMFDAALALDRLHPVKAKGETDYNNKEVEKLLDQAMVNMDPEERTKQYQKAQEIIAEDRPQIYLYQLDGVYGVNDRIKFTPRIDEMIYVEDVILAK